jgi:hypothetical protein
MNPNNEGRGLKMRRFPTMTYRNYIRKYASQTKDGMFFCQICFQWINKQRWIHFKKQHRYSDKHE